VFLLDCHLEICIWRGCFIRLLISFLRSQWLYSTYLFRKRQYFQVWCLYDTCIMAFNSSDKIHQLSLWIYKPDFKVSKTSWDVSYTKLSLKDSNSHNLKPSLYSFPFIDRFLILFELLCKSLYDNSVYGNSLECAFLLLPLFWLHW
jgi:hypothetical protein